MQFPLLAPRRRPWTGSLAGLVMAVWGGLLWRGSDAAPWKLRAAELLVACGVVAAVWFHFRQLSLRRTPTTALWPGVLVALTGLGPCNALLDSPPHFREPPEVRVVDGHGNAVRLPRADRRRVAELWFRIGFQMPDDLSLYAPDDAARIRALPDAERWEKGGAGELGLALLHLSALRSPLKEWEITEFRLDGDPGMCAEATATATDGTSVIRFGLVRARPDAAQPPTWFLSSTKVEFR